MIRYPGLDYRPVLRPLIDCPELAVHVVTTSRQVDLPEGTPQHLFADHALGDFLPRYVHVRRRRGFGRDQLGPLEVVVIVASAAAESKYSRHPETPSAGPADALLIVEPDRRHVGESDGLK